MRNDLPQVSVIIPSHRGGQLLREAIVSVQAQTFENWEVIIVLDGCEDNLSDIEATDDRVRVYRQKNRGVSISRNVGISLAKSDLIAFLDDDDRMLPERLNAQVEAMQSSVTGLCHTQFRLIDEMGDVIGTGSSHDSQYRDFLMGRGEIFFGSVVVRKSLVQETGGFNPLLVMDEDVDFIYRVARETTLHFIPLVLTEYRRHASNTSATMLAGGARRSILRQHLAIATTRNERTNQKLIRKGISLAPSELASHLMASAFRSRSSNHFISVAFKMMLSLILSPRFTLNVVRSTIQSMRTRK